MHADVNIPRHMFFLFVLTCFFSLTVGAAPPEAPEHIEGVTRINAEKLVELVQANPDFIVIDARLAGDQQEGYLEGSLNLPNTDTDCKRLQNVIPGKNHPIIFYCNGVRCIRSANAARIALSCGYNNIYWFRGGFKEWQSKGYPYLVK